MSMGFHEIAEAKHRLMNPFSIEKLHLLGESCCLQQGHTLLDLACGKGEMLCQWSSRFGIRGIGVDTYLPFLEDANRRAVELGVSDVVTFLQDDAAGFLANNSAGFDVVSCLGATWIGNGFSGSLELMKTAKQGSDGLLLVGEPFWSQPPPEHANVGWGESRSLENIYEDAENAGLEIIEMVMANQDEWDRFEASQWKAISDWLRDNPDHPNSREFSEKMEKSRCNYLRYDRRYLGWGVFVLRQARSSRPPG